jgi:hypothetical protein
VSVLDASLPQLLALPALSELVVSKTEVTPQGLQNFRRLRPACRVSTEF